MDRNRKNKKLEEERNGNGKETWLGKIGNDSNGRRDAMDTWILVLGSRHCIPREESLKPSLSNSLARAELFSRRERERQIEEESLEKVNI